MFWKHKKEILKDTTQKTEINKESKELNNKNFPNSVEIKDLELGKTYFRLEVHSNDIDFQKIIIIRKGTQLPYSYSGWLLSTQVFNYVVWAEVDTSFYKYNMDINDLLQENHKDQFYGPFNNDDTTFESDYQLNERVAFFDITSNLNDIKDNISEFWQKLADKVLKEKKEYYDKQLENDRNKLIEQFKSSMDEIMEEN